MGFWRKIFATTGGKNEESGHNFDPELRYCPACGGEYRPEISHCAACGLELVAGAERIATWQQHEDERATLGREIAATDVATTALTGKLRDMKASALVLAESGIASRITAISGCSGG